MSRSVAVALFLALLCAGGAVGCFARAQKLRAEARWIMERGTAEGDEYAATFNGEAAEKQLSSFEQRRTVLERASVWQRLQMVFVLASVIAAFASYVLFLFRRLREQLVDATSPLDEDEKAIDPRALLASSTQLH